MKTKAFYVCVLIGISFILDTSILGFAGVPADNWLVIKKELPCSAVNLKVRQNFQASQVYTAYQITSAENKNRQTEIPVCNKELVPRRGAILIHQKANEVLL